MLQADPGNIQGYVVAGISVFRNLYDIQQYLCLLSRGRKCLASLAVDLKVGDGLDGLV